MPLIKNIKVGNLNKIFRNFTIFVSIIICTIVKSDENLVGENTDLKILDKISSKNKNKQKNNNKKKRSFRAKQRGCFFTRRRGDNKGPTGKQKKVF